MKMEKLVGQLPGNSSKEAKLPPREQEPERDKEGGTTKSHPPNSRAGCKYPGSESTGRRPTRKGTNQSQIDNDLNAKRLL